MFLVATTVFGCKDSEKPVPPSVAGVWKIIFDEPEDFGVKFIIEEPEEFLICETDTYGNIISDYCTSGTWEKVDPSLITGRNNLFIVCPEGSWPFGGNFHIHIEKLTADSLLGEFKFADLPENAPDTYFYLPFKSVRD